MIPLRLTLRNFLSYREATLDFRGLHMACICGPNGSGKSSLLEAIGWVLWGESRVATEDDIVHLGDREAHVDFIFQLHQQIYRVLRTRQLGQATTLEFQIALETSDESLETLTFRPLTAKGVRATQQVIEQQLKLDYDTFVNSAYLRQGRADEFMLKRPSERKQILASLLKLDQYDLLAERARERSRQYKANLEVLEQRVQTVQTELRQGDRVTADLLDLQTKLADLQQQQADDRETQQQLQAQQQQRQQWNQQLQWQQQHRATLQQAWERCHQELTAAEQQQQQLAALIQQAATIVQAYQHLQTLQAEDESLTTRFQAHQATWEQRQTLHQQYQQQVTALQTKLHQAQTQWETLQQQRQEVEQILEKASTVEAALEQLQQARLRLNQYDRLQADIAPLLQRQQQLRSQLDVAKARLSARLEELQTSAQQCQQRQASQTQLQQAVWEVAENLEYLEKRRHYQEQVREKGLERRSFMERLQAHQRNFETQLAVLEQKLQLLQAPDAACPLCDRPLDEHHWAVVSQRHDQQRQEILGQVWVVREQLVTSEREIQVLRREYRELERELAPYHVMLERRGQLQEQLQAKAELQQRLQQLTAEQEQLARSLQEGDYAADLRQELTFLEQKLSMIYQQSLPYDEKDHALARGEVERWRWAEIKQAEIRQALTRRQQLDQRQPQLTEEIAHLQESLKQAETDPLRQQLDRLDQQLADLAYDRAHHEALRQAIKESYPWQMRYQELGQAQQRYPQVQQQVQELSHLKQLRQQDLQTITDQISTLTQQLETLPDLDDRLQTLETKIQQQRQQMDEHIVQLGRLQQRQQQLESLQQEQTTLKTQLQQARHQHYLYQELAQAFGKNGIQALMIENILPQLEAEANQLLARLSNNQLHLTFITQRAKKSKGNRIRPGQDNSLLPATHSDWIDTLDIHIADNHGTRPYETYSGGEAFRVNFAIRLALSCLLAQRSGTALQLLIVDEGFGSQDAEGCDRLVAAIQAIAPDFACILMVTHVPHFREAFQTRIEVTKTEEGSQVQLQV